MIKKAAGLLFASRRENWPTRISVPTYFDPRRVRVK